MKALEIVASEWRLLTWFCCVYAAGHLAAEVFFRTRRDAALASAEDLDRRRQKYPRIIWASIHKEFGLVRATCIIFSLCLVGGSFVWSTLGGVLLVPPFAKFGVAGFLVNMTLKRYPERLRWMTIPNVVLEIGAFMIAAVGGVGIGLSILSGQGVMPALLRWGTLFLTLVIPLQLAAAWFEALLFRRIYVVEGHPWPHGTEDG